MQTTQIWLIRHGETAWNAEQRLQGWRDIPLNEAGKQQALSIQHYLQNQTVRFDAVLSSDLQRAIDTAQIAFADYDVPLEQLTQLRERNYGIYEGHPWRQLLQLPDQPEPEINIRDPKVDIPEGESLLVFNQRIIHAFEDIALQRPQQNIAVIAHGGVIDQVWRKIQNIDLSTPRFMRIANASVNQFSINSATQQWQDVAWGQVEHLAAVHIV